MSSAARMPECPRCRRPLEQVSNSEETWMRCPGCFYDADRSIKPPSSAATGRFRRWIERVIFPWNDPVKQAEYDADPDDLIRSGYGW